MNKMIISKKIKNTNDNFNEAVVKNGRKKVEQTYEYQDLLQREISNQVKVDYELKKLVATHMYVR